MFLVVKVGACADLLLADGNLLKDLSGVTGVNNLKVIIKDGKIYKNRLNCSHRRRRNDHHCPRRLFPADSGGVFRLNECWSPIRPWFYSTGTPDRPHVPIAVQLNEKAWADLK